MNKYKSYNIEEVIELLLNELKKEKLLLNASSESIVSFDKDMKSKKYNWNTFMFSSNISIPDRTNKFIEYLISNAEHIGYVYYSMARDFMFPNEKTLFINVEEGKEFIFNNILVTENNECYITEEDVTSFEQNEENNLFFKLKYNIDGILISRNKKGTQ